MVALGYAVVRGAVVAVSVIAPGVLCQPRVLFELLASHDALNLLVRDLRHGKEEKEKEDPDKEAGVNLAAIFKSSIQNTHST